MIAIVLEVQMFQLLPTTSYCHNHMLICSQVMHERGWDHGGIFSSNLLFYFVLSPLTSSLDTRGCLEINIASHQL